MASGGGGGNPFESGSGTESNELQSVLSKAGLLHLLPGFVGEKVNICQVYKTAGCFWGFAFQVTIDVIPFLKERDWERLGVATVGDRVVLVQMCKAKLSE